MRQDSGRVLLQMCRQRGLLAGQCAAVPGQGFNLLPTLEIPLFRLALLAHCRQGPACQALVLHCLRGLLRGI